MIINSISLHTDKGLILAQINMANRISFDVFTDAQETMDLTPRPGRENLYRTQILGIHQISPDDAEAFGRWLIESATLTKREAEKPLADGEDVPF